MERIIKDPNKNYLEEEPFFISSADGRQVDILRPADFSPLKGISK